MMVAPSNTDYNQTPNVNVIYIAVSMWAIRSMYVRETAQTIS